MKKTMVAIRNSSSLRHYHWHHSAQICVVSVDLVTANSLYKIMFDYNRWQTNRICYIRTPPSTLLNVCLTDSLLHSRWAKFTKSKLGNWPFKPDNLMSMWSIFSEWISKLIAAWIAPARPLNFPESSTPRCIFKKNYSNLVGWVGHSFEWVT